MRIGFFLSSVALTDVDGVLQPSLTYWLVVRTAESSCCGWLFDCGVCLGGTIGLTRFMFGWTIRIFLLVSIAELHGVYFSSNVRNDGCRSVALRGR